MNNNNSPDSLEYLVSNIDIQDKFNQNINIITYKHLIEYKTLMDLLPQKICACFILLKTSFHSGHWTVIVRYYNNIYYFDSYGVKPDGEIKHINPHLRYELGESHKYLTELINKSKFNVIYNNFQFQSYHEDINTCGKWCTIFAKTIIEGLTLKSFTSGIKNLKNIYVKEHPSDHSLAFDKIISMLYTTY